MPTLHLKAFHASRHAYYKASSRYLTVPSRQTSRTPLTSSFKSSVAPAEGTFPKCSRFVHMMTTPTDLTLILFTLAVQPTVMADKRSPGRAKRPNCDLA